MWRACSFRLAVAAGAMAFSAGCSHDGDFTLAWQFAGAVSAPADACGLHGVDSILVTGSSDAGDGTDVVELCKTGRVRRKVPAGTWTFSLHTLDGFGNAIRPLDSPDGTTDPAAISAGGLTEFPPVEIAPRPACSDGIDNDRDGRVDLDDPDCAGDPSWTDESTPKM